LILFLDRLLDILIPLKTARSVTPIRAAEAMAT
jgi:hypothetical protein